MIKITIAGFIVRVFYIIIALCFIVLFDYFQTKSYTENPLYGMLALLFMLLALPFVFLSWRVPKQNKKDNNDGQL